MLRWIILLLPLLLTACGALQGPVGMVWQPDAVTTRPHGNWQQIGVHSLLVQWSIVDDLALVSGCGAPLMATAPDWNEVAAEPWAQDIILGLGGRFFENEARARMPELLAQSRCIAALPLPFKVSGWYFPVEIDPTWQDAAALAPILNQLPRPLWVTVYDNSNIGGKPLADWLEHWLPPDVGVLFQDGVGLHVRSPAVAVDYMKALQRRLGPERVRLIGEAFRPQSGGGFRPASVDELAEQLRAYAGYDVYLFEARYVPQASIDGLREKIKPSGR
ncbi:hypothetical protein GJ698_01995 [Pseudoduganella sp. FT26W]|uniref:Uncharacterized protein n=1 Tax=Duganella aquatilis TaxID=2666082 RepID=A0A844D2G0_9BURK|nr:hypothetical protein [Duganella aquatilis]MRW82862.1 hypothetical protein [Duganella aquatilis]